jgi:hypothetical protein
MTVRAAYRVVDTDDTTPITPEPDPDPEEDTAVIDPEEEPEAAAPGTRSPLALLSGGGTVVTQSELSEAARDAGIPVLNIGENGVPLIGVSGYAYWSLIDLAIAALGILFALWYIFRRRRRESEIDSPLADVSGAERPRRSLITFVIVTAAANTLLFLLTQDFTGTPLVVADIWTIPEAALFIVECVLGHLATRRSKTEAGEPEYHRSA